MKNIILFFISIFCIGSFEGYSQEVLEKNFATFDDFLKEQNTKLDSIKNGISNIEVEEIMGTSIVVKVPKVGRKKPLNQLFKQPEFSNEYDSNALKKIKVLWYFSTPKDRNGIISKGECTPVIIQNDSVVGKGRVFFNNYRRSVRLR
jgi:hypothetical protein